METSNRIHYATSRIKKKKFGEKCKIAKYTLWGVNGTEWNAWKEEKKKNKKLSVNMQSLYGHYMDVAK